MALGVLELIAFVLAPALLARLAIAAFEGTASPPECSSRSSSWGR